ncbi:MAG TPA: DUF6644 family protein [Caulobacteraceae bacterium]|nr:DUF6644 family protein [Caulobacteraceae bacterium]
MKQFAAWLATTFPSVFIKTQQAWMIPTIQTIHIVGIGIAIGSVFLITLRILGWAGTDQTLQQIHRRFAPWLKGAVWVLAATGLLMIVGEPARELVSFSFWAKMTLLAVGLTVVTLFGRTVKTHEAQWDEALARRGSVKVAAVATFLVWLGVIVLGRLIAYDHVWGPLSPAARY